MDHLDALAREPMVVRHPGGALFLSGYSDPEPRLWRSDDDGATWRRIPVGDSASGAAGNSDVDLAVGPDGTLYFITMVFDRAALEGVSIQVAASHDTGATWQWTRLSGTRLADRPWIEVAPDGTAHAIWNDGAGVAHAMSTDGGRTWTEGPRVNPLGGSSHLAVGPNGELAVNVVPLSASGNRFDAGVAFVATSTDRGATWTRHPPPGEREWFPMRDTTTTPPTWSLPPQPRWVEPLAFDAAGALYSLWVSGPAVHLARSADLGATWTTWQVAGSEATPFFPYLVARGPGELAASWFTAGDSLLAHVAVLRVGTDSTPAVALAPPFRPESYSPADSSQGDSAGEYLPLVWLPDGLGVASPIQHPAASRLGFSWRRYRLE
ncbi:MAG: sialidase family protein [Gemmatimonadales bacterium]